MKRTVSLLLCSLLLTSALAACSGEKASGNAETTATLSDAAESDTAETTTAEPSNIDAVKAAYDGISYDGYVFRVLSPSPGKHFYVKTSEIANEIYFEAQTGDALNDSIYERNIKTEEMLGIKIEPIFSGETDNVTSVTKKTILAGDDSFDCAINRLDFQMNLSSEKLLYNLMDISSIDTSHVWWDKNIVPGFTMFGDQLYAIAGDINFYDDYAVQMIMMNQRMAESLGYGKMYDEVRNGSWTFDLFSEMCKAAASDLNGDGKITIADDQTGFGNHGDTIIHFLYPFGEKLTATDSNGDITVNYGSEHLNNVVTAIFDFFSNKYGIVDNTASYIPAFKEGRVLFFADMVGALADLRQMEDNFSVLPMFKGDESQDGYHAYVSNGWTTAYSVPVTNADVERTGVVLETMSAISSETVTPALYGVMLNEKYVRDADSQEMLEYVWASKYYDIAGDLAWASPLRSVYQGLATSSSNTFVSSMEKKIASINSSLEKFLASYQQ